MIITIKWGHLNIKQVHLSHVGDKLVKDWNQTIPT